MCRCEHCKDLRSKVKGMSPTQIVQAVASIMPKNASSAHQKSCDDLLSLATGVTEGDGANEELDKSWELWYRTPKE